ncbi:hypothetical protein ILYODFUR_034912 [Ilyodon furcidens]|uniref:Uncharacterized protein n=1 Tax=Ilyodon furcidens TaxID=33524 RepID=A0ABV0U324_9TELE
MARPPKCKLRASIGNAAPHRQTNRNHQGQPGSQAESTTHHPAHHHAQWKDAALASQRVPQKGYSTRSKEAELPPERQNHQHPGQPSKNDRAKPSCSSPQANATPTPHILLYVGRYTGKITNPKHTPPTRNHPADKQTPLQAEKPDATAELSDAHPAAPTPSSQSRRAQDPCPNTTACHTAEDRTRQKAHKVKAVHKRHTANAPPPAPRKEDPQC